MTEQTWLHRYTDSIKELIAWFVGALVLANAGYCLFEHVGPWDSFWWSWVTGTTTGYGDMYAHTTGGRIVTVLWMAFMFIWACVFTARLASHMIVDNDAFTNDEQEELKDGIRLALDEVCEIRQMLQERETP